MRRGSHACPQILLGRTEQPAANMALRAGNLKKQQPSPRARGKLARGLAVVTRCLEHQTGV